MASPAGFEPATYALGGRRAILLCHGDRAADCSSSPQPGKSRETQGYFSVDSGRSSLRRPDEKFRLGIKAENAYGNPSDRVDAELGPVASAPLDGLPDSCRFARGARELERQVRIRKNRILKTREINAWNPHRVLNRDRDATLSRGSVTAGNFGAFHVWLDGADAATVHLETEHVDVSIALADVGRENHVIPAGGLGLEVHLFRLPDRLQDGPLIASVEVPIHNQGDNPLWIRATTEDEFQAWARPVYLFKRE